jgi:transposase
VRGAPWRDLPLDYGDWKIAIIGFTIGAIMTNSAGAFAVVGTLLDDLNDISRTIATNAPLLINQSYSRDFECMIV